MNHLRSTRFDRAIKSGLTGPGGGHDSGTHSARISVRNVSLTVLGETFHHARICHQALLEELSAASGAAVHQRDSGPLLRFLHGHAERSRAIDGFRVPLDRARIAEAHSELVRLVPRAAHSELLLLVEATKDESLPRGEVGKTAQDSLLRRLERLASFLASRFPPDLISLEVRYAQASVAALETADLSARLDGLDEPYDGQLIAQCLDLCTVPGLDHDVGLGRLSSEAFVSGSVLIPFLASPDDPSGELFERTLTRFGLYSADGAWEILREDWLRFAASFTYYQPPCWAEGADLDDSIRRVREAADAEANGDDEPDDDDPSVRHEEIRRAIGQYRMNLTEARSAGYAVVEWVEKQ